MTSAQHYITAARCPETIPTGDNGLWKLERVYLDDPRLAKPDPTSLRRLGGFPYLTILSYWTLATLHQNRGDIVMEDSPAELRRHMPIWLNAKGRVLITGLGLGCVLRGLLANPAVTHVTVVEIDSTIIRWVWPEFMASERALLLQGDAFEIDWPPGTRYDFAWHDIYHEERHEAVLHSKLMVRYREMCAAQGAWGLPRWYRRRIGGDFVHSSAPGWVPA